MGEGLDFWKKKDIIKPIENRNFGTMIGMPFHFLTQEFKGITRVLLKYALPFVLVGILFMYMAFMPVYNRFGILRTDEAQGYFFLVGLFYIASTMVAMAVSNSYFALYTHKGKDNFTDKEVRDLTKKSFWKIFFVYLLLSFLSSIYMSIITVMTAATGSFVSFLIFLLPYIYLLISLVFIPISITYEKKTFSDSFKRSFDMTKSNWWYNFGVMVVFGLVMYVIFYNSIVIPITFWQIMNTYAEISGLMNWLSVIGGIAFIVVMYLLMISLSQFLAAFLYFRIYNKKYGNNLDSRIKNIYKENKINKKQQRKSNISEAENYEINYDRFKPH